MTKRATMALCIALSFLLGTVVGWYLQRSRCEQDQATLVVVDGVGVADLCASSLEAVEQGKAATLQRVLENRMAGAVNYAAERVGCAAPVGFPVPNLVEGLNRVRRYAVAKGMSGVVEKCDRLIEFLAVKS